MEGREGNSWMFSVYVSLFMVFFYFRVSGILGVWFGIGLGRFGFRSVFFGVGCELRFLIC